MSQSALYKADAVMNNLSDSVEHLIMGNSHALALQTANIPKAANIATYGEELHHTYFKLNHVINTNKKIPKALILSCDLGLLSDKDVDNQNYQFYWSQYESFTELYAYSKEPIQFSFNRFFDLIFPYRNTEADAFDFFLADESTVKNARLRQKNSIKALDPQESRIVKDSCQQQQISPLGEHFFESLLKLCDKNNIKVYLIRFPVTAHYYFTNSKCFLPEVYYKDIEKQFLSKYSNVYILDFHDLYDKSKFYDPHHLNQDIRPEFTTLVYKKMLELSS